MYASSVDAWVVCIGLTLIGDKGRQAADEEGLA